MSQIEFDVYYESVFLERWTALKSALMAPEVRVQRPNGFCTTHSPMQSGQEIPRSADGLLEYYVMDQASIWAAQALDVQAGDVVLDMCAAPGGKTLVLAEALREQGELTANEMSAARRDRLTQVIRQYIPRDIRERVFVTGRDGGLFARSHAEKFDRILVDAPCSGERHLLENVEELSQWRLSRSEKLAQRQYALLTAALLAVKPGGIIVYSTCAISPLENDGVVERLLKKKDGFKVTASSEVRKIAGSQKGVEETRFGIQILPDVCEGLGPIYIAKLQRD